MSPMIGIADVKRTSIMDRIKLTFSNVGPKDPFFKKKAECPQHTEFYWTTDSRVNKAERVLEIQDYEMDPSKKPGAATLARWSKAPTRSWWPSELLPSTAFFALDIVS